MTRLYYFAVSERGIEGGAAELGELAVGLLPGCRQAVSWVCRHLRAGLGWGRGEGGRWCYPWGITQTTTNCWQPLSCLML